MRLPLFRGFYATVKQVGEAFLGEKRDAFQRVVLIEYPTTGRYAIAFVTASPASGARTARCRVAEDRRRRRDLRRIR